MTAQNDRIAAILRIMNELETLREMYGSTKEPWVPNAYPFGIELGECDWLEELHRLLYGVQDFTQEVLITDVH
jgi:hypothetical protein